MPYAPSDAITPSLPLWLAILLAIIAASGTWLATFLNRKRRSSVRAEDAKNEATARNLDVQTISNLLDDVRETRDEVRDLDKKSRQEHSRLWAQLVWHEEQTTLARRAAHAAINEVQRCVYHIDQREAAIQARKAYTQTLEDLLVKHSVGFTRAVIEDVTPFEQKPHEDLVKYNALPMPPKPLEL